MPSEPFFNIGEVSQQTGVSPVTLRAWERRYSLIKPKRTPKGHRLYNQDNIDQIKQVVSWLNRGVTISKVAPLLSIKTIEIIDVNQCDDWQHQQQQLVVYISHLQQQQADQLIDELTKTTPFETLCEQLFQPVFVLLTERWLIKPLGYQLEQQIWHQVWQRQTTVMSLRAGKQKPQAQCWLVSVDGAEFCSDFYLLFGLLINASVRVNVINANAELGFINRLQQTRDIPLLVFGHQRLAKPALKQLETIIASWGKTALFAGNMVDINTQIFQQSGARHAGGCAIQCWQDEQMNNWLSLIKQLK